MYFLYLVFIFSFSLSFIFIVQVSGYFDCFTSLRR